MRTQPRRGTWKQRIRQRVALGLCCGAMCWAPLAAQDAPENSSQQAVIPAGAKIPLRLTETITTRNAKAGDPVYAETAMPFFASERKLIPAGTTVLGVVTGVERAGRRRRAGIQMRFTSMVFSDGYAVPLTGALDNVPGAENLSVSEQGFVQGDSETGRRLVEGGRNAAHGMWVGSMGGLLFGTSLTAMRAGGGAGIALGLGWALFRRGSELRLERGTRIEMVVRQPATLDVARPSEAVINNSE